MDKFTLTYTLLFLISILYAYVLSLWRRHWPESYDDLTWLSVVVGVGYVLLGLYPLLPLEHWLVICRAFFAASIPIILRSLIIHARHRREANHIWEEDE